MENKLSIKSIIVFTLIGYICVLVLRYIEGILSSILKIACMLLQISSKFYIFIDVIPEILIIVFWVVLIFKYLKEFNWDEIISYDLTKKFVKKLIIFAIILYAIRVGASFLENYILDKSHFRFDFESNLMVISGSIISILNFFEVILIVSGLYRVMNNKSSISN